MGIEASQLYHLLERLSQLNRHALVAQLSLAYAAPETWEPRLMSFFVNALMGLGQHKQALAILKSSDFQTQHPGAAHHLTERISIDIAENPFLSHDSVNVRNLNQDLPYKLRISQIKALMISGDAATARAELSAIHKRYPGRHESSDLIWALDGIGRKPSNIKDLITRSEDLVNDFTDEDITVVDGESDDVQLFDDDGPTESQVFPVTTDDPPEVQLNASVTKGINNSDKVKSGGGLKFIAFAVIFLVVLSAGAGWGYVFLNNKRIEKITAQSERALTSGSYSQLIDFKRIIERKKSSATRHQTLYSANLALACAMIYRDFDSQKTYKTCAEENAYPSLHPNLYRVTQMNLLLAEGDWDAAKQLQTKSHSPMLSALNTEIDLYDQKEITTKPASIREKIVFLQYDLAVEELEGNLWADLLNLESNWLELSKAERTAGVEGLWPNRINLGSKHHSRLLTLKSKLSKPNRAKKLRKDAYDLDPQNGPNLYLMGLDAYTFGELDSAQSIWSKCERISLDCAQMRFLSLMDLERFVDAQALISNHLSHLPFVDDLREWVKWAESGFGRIRFSGFIGDYFNLKLFDSESYPIKSHLLARLKSAKTVLRKTRGLNNLNDVNLLLAIHFYRTKQLKKALRYAETAVSKNPSHPFGWRILTLLYLKRWGKNEKSRHAYKAYLHLNPNGPQMIQLRDMFK